MNRLLSIVVLLTCLLGLPQARAQGAAGPEVSAEIIAGHRAAVPGTTLPIAIRFRFSEGWHAFWVNPGNTGFPTRFKWTLPEGVAAPATLRWPTPDKFLAIGGASLIDTDSAAGSSHAPAGDSPFGPSPFDLTTPGGEPVDAAPAGEYVQIAYGYHHDYIVLTELAIPADYAGETLTMDLALTMQVCQEVCVLASPKATLTVPVAPAGSAPELAATDLWPAAESAMPVEPGAWTPSVTAAPGAISLRLEPPADAAAIERLVFIPLTGNIFDIQATQPLTRDGDAYVLTLPLVGAAPERLTGVLVADRPWNGTGSRGMALDLPTGAAPAPPDDVLIMGGEVNTVWGAIAFGLLGGFILNLLPCVLPILSIKILSFVEQAKSDKTTPLAHGIAYAIGVLVTFVGLAVVLLALRAGASSIGWGFQQQSPIFTLCVVLVFFVFALSLFGVFEFGTSLTTIGNTGGGGLLGSFVTGLLAVLVATPCTGPFMGPAITWALAQPAGVVIAVFLSLGIGMAAPYVVLTASPKLLRLIPKPGEWMVTMKQFFGFLLMLSVVWFLYPLQKIASYETVIWTLVALVLVGVGFWLVGRWTTPINSRRKRLSAWAICSVLTLLGIALVVRSLAPTSEWQAWSPEAVAAARADGDIVFIDFTADWCANCKINEAFAFNSEVHERFEELDVTLFIADWTGYDPRIGEALAEFQRSGIPVYVVYSPNGTVTVIDGLIKPSDLLDALDRAAADVPES